MSAGNNSQVGSVKYSEENSFMDESMINMIAYLGFFLLGIAAMLYVLRGVAWPYLKSKKGALLLLAIGSDGQGLFTTGKLVYDDLMVSYKVKGKEHIASVDKNAVLPAARTRLMAVNTLDTAPYRFDTVHEVLGDVERMMPVLNDKGEQVIDEETKKPIYEKRIVQEPVVRLFRGWNDSAQILTALKLCAAQPKIPLNIGGLGIDKKKAILIVIAVIVIGYLAFKQFAGGAGVPSV